MANSKYGEDANRLRLELDKAEVGSDLEYQIILEFLNSFASRVATAQEPAPTFPTHWEHELGCQCKKCKAAREPAQGELALAQARLNEARWWFEQLHSFETPRGDIWQMYHIQQLETTLKRMAAREASHDK